MVYIHTQDKKKIVPLTKKISISEIRILDRCDVRNPHNIIMGDEYKEDFSIILGTYGSFDLAMSVMKDISDQIAESEHQDTVIRMPQNEWL